MSRSNPTEKQANPATRFFEWKGKTGVLQYWDKEKKENVVVKTPFTFLALDELVTIKGYCKGEQSGVFSNEIRDTRSDTLVVKTFAGTELGSGLYTDIRDKVTSKRAGGVFAFSLYVAYKDQDDLKIGNISISGSALGPWIDFKKAHKGEIYKGAITISTGDKQTSGVGEFFPPVFKLKGTTEETDAKAKELDQVLQVYFAEYFSRKKVEQATAEPEPPLDVVDQDFEKYQTVAADDDDIPF